MALRAAEEPSHLHAGVSAALASLRVGHSSNVCVGHGVFLADVLTDKPQMVVMVDGPSSFTLNTCSPLGEDALNCSVQQLSLWQ